MRNWIVSTEAVVVEPCGERKAGDRRRSLPFVPEHGGVFWVSTGLWSACLTGSDDVLWG